MAKNMFESGEVMGYYAEIDLGYHMLEMLMNDTSREPKNGIEAMIDKSTGYDKIRQVEKIDAAINWFEHIIKYKKLVEIDTTDMESDLIKIKEIKTNYTS